MKTYSVVFAPEAEDDLVQLYEYIAEHGSPTTAARYTEAIVACCEGLATMWVSEENDAQPVNP